MTERRLPIYLLVDVSASGKMLTAISNSAQRNADGLTHPPNVFILSADGRTTECVEEGLATFKNQKWGRVGVCAAGDGADLSALKRVVNNDIVKLNDLKVTTIGLPWLSSGW